MSIEPSITKAADETRIEMSSTLFTLPTPEGETSLMVVAPEELSKLVAEHWVAPEVEHQTGS